MDELDGKVRDVSVGSWARQSRGNAQDGTKDPTLQVAPELRQVISTSCITRAKSAAKTRELFDGGTGGLIGTLGTLGRLRALGTLGRPGAQGT